MSYRIIQDKDGSITEWVCRGLGYNTAWLNDYLTFGFEYDNKLVGGLIFHDWRCGHDIWWTVYTVNPHWCNRNMLRQMFAVAFNTLRCRRINLLVSKHNQRSLNFVRRLGFKAEGLLREYRENGDDCYFFGMLAKECPWLNQKGEKHE